jgi:flagellar FliJ protein
MAKGFNFNLQPVLEQRTRIEEQKQQIVAQRQHALDDAERELARLNDDFREHSDALRSEHRNLDAEQLRMHYAHLQYLDRVILAQIRVVAELRVMLDPALGDLLQASRERKVVIKLKERRHEAFVTEELRVEQNELDDANARRHGRAQTQLGGLS